jgi:hypothetical protein
MAEAVMAQEQEEKEEREEDPREATTTGADGEMTRVELLHDLSSVQPSDAEEQDRWLQQPMAMQP